MTSAERKHALDDIRKAPTKTAREAFLLSEIDRRDWALEKAVKAARNYGITIDYDEKYQPWAREANTWLRAQNLEIEHRIRIIISETLGEE